MSTIQSPYGLSTSWAALSGEIYLPILAQTLDRHLRPISCSSPQFNAVELLRQMKLAKVTFIIAHSGNVATVISAARLAGLPSNRVILIDQRPYPSEPRIPSVRDLIQEGIKRNLDFEERVLESGEGRKKVALLSWSSGTTGKPKVNVTTTPM
ncbi:hypothetical protein H0H87_006694 [Tephrocybe sp. NHM501043]|nr:hypothetical protein H0H87_006694 [Tephrocybe sp. NHM501043]